ncbi:MAG: hypothetical protein ABJA98_30545 [Acidobacteriota bacterium]
MTIDDIRTFCRGLAGTTQDVKWQSDLAFSVGGKMYLVKAGKNVSKNDLKTRNGRGRSG